MPVSLKPPIEETIYLDLPEEVDSVGEKTYVVIKQATQGDVERIGALTEDASRIYREGETELRQKWNAQVEKRLQVYLTLIGCNIETSESTPEKPVYLFKFRSTNNKSGLAMTEAEFAKAWNALPETWATAIHNAVLKVNKSWNPNYQPPLSLD